MKNQLVIKNHETDTLMTDMDEIIDYLKNILPHGSGINYNWNIEYKNGKVYASNSYEGMNEGGYYCHVYDFTAVYKLNAYLDHDKCQYCNGSGQRDESNLPEYHNFKTAIPFVCNVCEGRGYNMKNQFEMVRFNFHGQRENACCGYDLKNYLSEMLYNPEEIVLWYKSEKYKKLVQS
jgi:hypothetical protein